MSGIGLLLSTAKDALLTQQMALDVVGHNIANVNTPGYTRQIPQLVSRDPAPYEGLILGRGVDIEDVVRNSNSFIDARLQERGTELTAMEEKEIYFGVLEGIFNENSGRSLSAQLSEFWNAWHDLANNPSGMAERSTLYERGALISQSFVGLSEDLSQLTREINLALDSSVNQVNEIASKIADLNEQIVSLKVTGSPNDLIDQRAVLLGQLSKYLDIRSYEHEDGNLTVTTGRGYVLVSRSESYSLSFDGGRVRWESSGSGTTDITDTLTSGKMGAWLDLRDETLPKYEKEMNELARSIVWEVNQIHAEGVGLYGFSTAVGTYASTDPAQALGSATSGLAFYDRIQDGSFKLWVYDSSGAPVDPAGFAIAIDADTTTLSALSAAIDGSHANISATVVNGKLSITATGGHSFAVSRDTSHALAALGVNTFFDGEQAADMAMNTSLETNKALIAAGRLGTSGAMAAGDNANALAMLRLPDQPLTLNRYLYERGEPNPTEQAVTGTLADYLYQFLGSVGVQSQSVTRSREYNEVIVNKLIETRDGISAVSIDEEMTNLIKYQKAYAVAAKLLSAADEMYQTLLETK